MDESILIAIAVMAGLLLGGVAVFAAAERGSGRTNERTGRGEDPIDRLKIEMLKKHWKEQDAEDIRIRNSKGSG